MRLAEVAVETKKKFVVTTDSKHDLPVAENVLDREFTASRPNERWVADISPTSGPARAGCISPWYSISTRAGSSAGASRTA
jgi:hypothetical protein